MSVRCARERGKYPCRQEEAGKSGLTDNSDGRCRRLRDGGFPCEQPGGSGVRRKEGNREGVRGVLIGAVSASKQKKIARIESRRSRSLRAEVSDGG
jgi:hypothetical protein